LFIEVISCCSVKKPDDYEYIPYQQKQTSTTNDYVSVLCTFATFV
jgi:hypothetical protein